MQRHTVDVDQQGEGRVPQCHGLARRHSLRVVQQAQPEGRGLHAHLTQAHHLAVHRIARATHQPPDLRLPTLGAIMRSLLTDMTEEVAVTRVDAVAARGDAQDGGAQGLPHAVTVVALAVGVGEVVGRLAVLRPHGL